MNGEDELDRAGSAMTHLPALDGVRGAAILLVLVCHTSNYLDSFAHWQSPGGRATFWTFGAGWVGVDLFFVLSGFLITRILLSTREQPLYFKNFYARRALRILPLYMAFCAALWLHCLYHPTPGYKGDLLSLVLYYNNIRQAFFGFHIEYAGPCWSLAVEEHFYLLWPLLIAYTPPRRLRMICLIGIGLSFGIRLYLLAHGLSVKVVYILTPCRLDGLLAGAWLADAFRQPDTWSQVRHYGRRVTAAAAIGLGLTLAYQHSLFDSIRHVPRTDLITHSQLGSAPLIVFLSIFFGGLLVEAISGNWFSACMRWQWLRAMGKYSYGMYLLHMLVVIGGRKLVVRLAPGVTGRWTLEPVFLVGVTLVTFAFAAVSYHVYEVKFLKLKGRFGSSRAA